MFSQIASEQEIRRVSVYRLLAWGLAYPTAERVVIMPTWQKTLEQASVRSNLSTRSIATALNLLPHDEADLLKTLQIEYEYLFINDIPELLAPPYASAYNHNGDIIKYPARSILEAYRQAEVTFYSENFELPDHLTVQLEFMHHLGTEALNAKYLNRSERVDVFEAFQQEFLYRHLLYWVPTWRLRVAKADRIGFYAALAQLIGDWLKTDAHHLGLLPLAD
ncbi:MAG: molecular chaperone TorD family protein [Anaerolineae bacterium]|nr:molecular chaperone TorD family protein [Anaerolineae bacterium]